MKLAAFLIVVEALVATHAIAGPDETQGIVAPSDELSSSTDNDGLLGPVSASHPRSACARNQASHVADGIKRALLLL